MRRPNRNAPTVMRSLLATAALVGSVLLAAGAPASASTPTTGVWIFPHASASSAVADSLDSSFYIGDSENTLLQDSFFADAGTDAASVAVDLYNPTGSQLYNVQLFASYSVDDLSLVTSIAFAGGASGDISYSGSDLESGGTPQMVGGVGIDGHDVYPAYFVSYGVGDIASGTAGIETVTLDISGDFASGLIVHLDYTAEDADGNGVSGPFEADMNVFDNGESTPPCTSGTFEISQSASSTSFEAGGSVDWSIAVHGTGGTLPTEFNRSEVESWTATHELLHGLGAGRTTTSTDEVATPASGWSNTTRTVTSSVLLLPGNSVALSVAVGWVDACTGEARSVVSGRSITVTVSGEATGKVHTAAWWQDQVEAAQKGKGAPAVSKDNLTLFLKRAALASDVFAYADWSGTAPSGDADGGAVDIDSFADALNVLDKKTDESKKVRGAEREDLALWLNIASGALNLDTKLQVAETKEKGKGSHSPFEEATGLKTLSGAYDTPREVLAFLEKQVKDWQGGHGASKGDLKLAKRLARSVDNGWLVPA